MYMKFKFSKKINNFSYIYRLLYSFSARVTIYYTSYRFFVRYLIREFVWQVYKISLFYYWMEYIKVINNAILFFQTYFRYNLDCHIFIYDIYNSTY